MNRVTSQYSPQTLSECTQIQLTLNYYSNMPTAYADLVCKLTRRKEALARSHMVNFDEIVLRVLGLNSHSIHLSCVVLQGILISHTFGDNNTIRVLCEYVQGFILGSALQGMML